MTTLNNRIQFDGKVNLATIISAIVILIAVVAGWVNTANSVERINEKQVNFELFQQTADQRYVTEEQLEYKVIERIDRLELRLEERILQLESKLQEQLNRIEEKIDRDQ